MSFFWQKQNTENSSGCYGSSGCSRLVKVLAVCLSFGVNPSPKLVSCGWIIRRAILEAVVSVR